MTIKELSKKLNISVDNLKKIIAELSIKIDDNGDLSDNEIEMINNKIKSKNDNQKKEKTIIVKKVKKHSEENEQKKEDDNKDAVKKVKIKIKKVVKKPHEGEKGDKEKFESKDKIEIKKHIIVKEKKEDSEKKDKDNRFKDKKTLKHEKTQPKEKEIQFVKKKKEESKQISIPKSIDIMETISVSELAKKLNIKVSELISKLMELGMMVTINQIIDADTAQIICAEYGCEVKIVSLYEETLITQPEDKTDDLKPRPPIVTIMGHVDHGKTTLLDYIRKTNVALNEDGGITQHIGAYKVKLEKGEIVFLDTPGHEAFTAMRLRGTNVTDIVVLVVAADEGVMPQTIEALNHAKAANVPIIVALNKMDNEGANPERVKQQLSEYGLLPEEWGGDTQYIKVSGKTGYGVNDLLEAILLTAEVLELKANPDRLAVGTIIESKIDQGRGPVATVLIQNGTLNIGDNFVAGIYYGKVRAIFDWEGKSIKQAMPSTPVEVLGIDGVPDAGDPFHVLPSEKEAKLISEKRHELNKFEQAKNIKKITLDNLYEVIQDGNIAELRIILKADVQGSVEALKDSLEKLSNKEVKVKVIHSATGAINENDVMLAAASDAIIIGFNIRPNSRALQLSEKENVDIRKYNIIYEVIDEVKNAMEGLLKPITKEETLGRAEVRKLFKVSKVGTIAGCMVIKGKIIRNANIRVIREGVIIYEGKIASLKRFKDDAKEVLEGYECGILVENFNDIKEGDELEAFREVKLAKKLTETKA